MSTSWLSILGGRSFASASDVAEVVSRRWEGSAFWATIDKKKLYMDLQQGVAGRKTDGTKLTRKID